MSQSPDLLELHGYTSTVQADVEKTVANVVDTILRSYFRMASSSFYTELKVSVWGSVVTRVVCRGSIEPE